VKAAEKNATRVQCIVYGKDNERAVHVKAAEKNAMQCAMYSICRAPKVRLLHMPAIA